MVQGVLAVLTVRRVWHLSLAILLVVCAAPPAAAQAPSARKAAEAAMLKADRDFNQAAADRDLNRFLSFVAEDAAFDSAEGHGRDGVAKGWAPFFAPGGPTISWRPASAVALVGADVGYTVGAWERHTKDAAGQPVVRHGQYLTVWRKQKDGQWQATHDTGSTAPTGARVRPISQ